MDPKKQSKGKKKKKSTGKGKEWENSQTLKNHRSGPLPWRPVDAYLEVPWRIWWFFGYLPPEKEEEKKSKERGKRRIRNFLLRKRRSLCRS
ncbi:hypothetical protein CEXT_731211 [Caerostris extrusa]|uniref:Uncharacterized protein n=1 Tax=Caerostris extrusa TaxID=172846 RepID=A0AAV4VWE1_CAEEX|nr:hypothetical protein CEXT_731211 [Caerostris extrusa]